MYDTIRDTYDMVDMEGLVILKKTLSGCKWLGNRALLDADVELDDGDELLEEDVHGDECFKMVVGDNTQSCRMFLHALSFLDGESNSISFFKFSTFFVIPDVSSDLISFTCCCCCCFCCLLSRCNCRSLRSIKLSRYDVQTLVNISLLILPMNGACGLGLVS